LIAEDVVRRIAGECAFVDERGGGIRLETGGLQPSHPRPTRTVGPLSVPNPNVFAIPQA
jgi:hypothetical protein